MQDWIDDFAKDVAIKEVNFSLAGERNISSAIRAQNQIPAFWRYLSLELGEAVRKLNENKTLSTTASVSDHSEPHENRIRVQVTRNGLHPELAYTDLFLLNGESHIRCHTMHGDAFKLRFAYRKTDETLGVYAESETGIIMTPEAVSRYIVEPMLRRVGCRQ